MGIILSDNEVLSVKYHFGKFSSNVMKYVCLAKRMYVESSSEFRSIVSGHLRMTQQGCSTLTSTLDTRFYSFQLSIK